MSVKKDLLTHERYFAAANGYGGFRSYFRDVFNRTDYTRLYVLKGGSGTGKSTLMKKISCLASEKKLRNEAIFCSSDPESLDGIIIYSQNKKFAIIDGTSPHEEDARYPGAIDEIINLGEFWNKSPLIESREKIVNLTEEKQFFYSNAYSNLNISSVFDKNIEAETLRLCNPKACKEMVDKILLALSRKKGTVQIRLVDAFCKFGFYSLPTLSTIAKTVVSVVGKFGSEYILLSLLASKIKEAGIESIHFPNPLDPKKINAIYIPEDGIAFVANASAEKFIDTEEMLNETKLCLKESELCEFSDMKKLFLNKAEEQFVFAADMHAELEKIYTPTMDFSKFDSLVDYFSKEIFKQ